MSDNHTNALVAIALAIVGLATLSVIVSNNANTSGVISAGTSGFAQLLQAATGPVTGGGSSGISLPNLGSFSSIP